MAERANLFDKEWSRKDLVGIHTESESLEAERQRERAEKHGWKSRGLAAPMSGLLLPPCCTLSNEALIERFACSFARKGDCP